MSSGTSRGLGIGCFVLCAILLFVAWERYDSNAKTVETMNRMMRSSPDGTDPHFGDMLKQMTGSSTLEPSVPTATKYALFFAALSAVGGGLFLVAAAKKGSGAEHTEPTT